METNRIEELLRDPTFEMPEWDYWEVRTPWFGVCVTRASARKIVEAMTGIVPETWVRAETVGGSTVYVRAETVMYVREWTRAQRASEREYWKEIDGEYEEKEEAEEPPSAPEGEDGESRPVQGAGAGEEVTPESVLLLVLIGGGLVLSGQGLLRVVEGLLRLVFP